MKPSHLVLLPLLLPLFSLVHAQTMFPPYTNQVHLSLGAPSSMIVTWSTALPTPSRVLLSSGEGNVGGVEVEGESSRFTAQAPEFHTQWIHRVELPNLQIGSIYTYQIHNATWPFHGESQDPEALLAAGWGLNGIEWGWGGYQYAERFEFRHMGGGGWAGARVVVYGDLGLENAVIVPALQYEVEHDMIDLIVHNGDNTYDDYEEGGTKADKWLNQVQSIAARVPYQMSQGNHENAFDALHYRNRFSMKRVPGGGEGADGWNNLFYSFDVGMAHFVAFDSEVYFANSEYLKGKLSAQLQFIESDLIEANKHRDVYPWILAFGHRPFMCSNDDDGDCVRMNDVWRIDLENLFYKYGVDIVLGAHQHSYERMWPTYNLQVLNSSTPNEPYTDPLAPILIVSGAGGCREDTSSFNKGPLGNWSALRISDYGYAHVTITDARTLQLTQHNGRTREIVDTMVVKKSQDLPAWIHNPKVAKPLTPSPPSATRTEPIQFI